jgi:hypothetical protein
MLAHAEQAKSLPDRFEADATFADLVEACNANVETLNAGMFTYLDYVLGGSR